MSDRLLFENMPRVPHPGKTDTSAEAAAKIQPVANTLRSKVLAMIRASAVGFTADEVAAVLSEDILSVRPRCSELARDGVIHDSGERRRNKSGNNQIVWRSAA